MALEAQYKRIFEWPIRSAWLYIHNCVVHSDSSWLSPKKL